MQSSCIMLIFIYFQPEPPTAATMGGLLLCFNQFNFDYIKIKCPNMSLY